VNAAKELGYHRNEIARSVVTGKSRSIGFLTASPREDMVGQMLTGAVDEAMDRGYFVSVLHLRNDHDVDTDTLERCLEMRLAGALVLYAGGAAFKEFRQEMSLSGAPVAILDDSEPQSRGLHLLTDYEMGMDQAVLHLTQLGHRDIVFLAGGAKAENNAGNDAREVAFLNALNRYALPITDRSIMHVSSMSKWNSVDIVRSLRPFIFSGKAPTAMICMTDQTALVAMRVIRACGLAVPDDISVVGFANLSVAETGDPPLTTVAQPFYTMGRVGMRLLVDKIEDTSPYRLETDALHQSLLPTSLVIRESTATVSSQRWGTYRHRPLNADIP
jgi:DNA-binding LacI/PurR family transcriptional regulator